MLSTLFWILVLPAILAFVLGVVAKAFYNMANRSLENAD